MRPSICLSLVVALLLAWGAVTGCGDDDDGQGDGGTDTDTDTDSDSNTEGVLPVDSSHTGWGNPCCWQCHGGSHHQELVIEGCAPCHGTNGASIGHTSCSGPNSGTTTCHAGAHGGEAAGFPPGTCGGCHG